MKARLDMKHLFSIIISAAILFAYMPRQQAAADNQQGYELSFTIDNGMLTVTGAAGSGSILDIPEKISGLPVTSIADDFFMGSNELAVVNLPDSLRYIGKRAFSACPCLNSVHIGSGTEYIGDYAFSACSSLREVNVSPENNAYHSENGSLYKDDALILYAGGSAAEISPSARVIEKRAFFGKTDITSVNIPESVTAIGDYAFSGCLELKDIKLPDSVVSIGDYCFLSCTALESAILSNSMKSVPESCFNGCDALKMVDIPDSVKEIGDNAFYSCENLISLYIPPSVETIGKNAVGRTYNIRSGSEENTADMTISGSSGSAAEKYAVSLGIAFSANKDTIKGDVNGDDIIDGKDATLVLTEYARMSAGKDTAFSDTQTGSADYNSDGIIDGKDATAILTYYARSSVSQ